MHRFSIIFYVLGVILCLIGFIMYNYSIMNDKKLITAALLIGVGVALLLGSYLE